jgi:signal recognition particle receptor subunit beta
MPTYNYKSRELIAKVVYYGPGRCGKTTNLQQIHAKMRPETRSELLSVATETDRTIYFDLLPLNLGTISGMKFMVRLFTVPGQVYYGETRKLVLRGADGVVFVADSQDHMLDENRQSLRDLKENLAANGIDYATIPLVLQYNKRDLPRLVSEAELDASLNDRGVKAIPAIASDGAGVLETLRFVTLSVFNHIKAGGKVDRPPTAQVPVPGAITGGTSVPPFGAPAIAAAPLSSTIPTAPSSLGGTGSNVFGGTAAGVPPAPLTGQGGALQRALAAAQAAAAPVQRGASGVNASDLGLPRPGATVTGAPLSPPMQGNLHSNIPRANLARPASSVVGAPLSAPPAGRQPPPPPAPTIPPSPSARAPVPNPNGPQPVRIGADMVLDEFKNLAVMHSQMAERLAAVEQELSRLGRENQEIREILARQNQP